VASACNFFKVKGTIFMPIDAPDIKVRAVKMFGGEYVNI
jgi:threonine dehydratase